MNEQRKHYSPEEKVAILYKHLVEKVAVSQVCEEHGLNPNVFYPPCGGQKEFFGKRVGGVSARRAWP